MKLWKQKNKEAEAIQVGICSATPDADRYGWWLRMSSGDSLFVKADTVTLRSVLQWINRGIEKLEDSFKSRYEPPAEGDSSLCFSQYFLAQKPPYSKKWSVFLLSSITENLTGPVNQEKSKPTGFECGSQQDAINLMARLDQVMAASSANTQPV